MDKPPSPPTPPHWARCFFDRKRTSVGQARIFVRRRLTRWGVCRRMDDIHICVSELATNALLHGTPQGRGFLVIVSVADDVVRLEVHDSTGSPPRAAHASAEDETGRGLLLVDSLSDGWGVRARQPFGKVVWAEFKLVGRAGVQPHRRATASPSHGPGGPSGDG